MHGDGFHVGRCIVVLLLPSSFVASIHRRQMTAEHAASDSSDATASQAQPAGSAQLQRGHGCCSVIHVKFSTTGKFLFFFKDDFRQYIEYRLGNDHSR